MTLDDIMNDVTLARTVRAARCGIFWFASGAVYVWEGEGPILAGSQTWQGLGGLASIEGAIELGPGLPTQPLELKMSVKQPMLAAALTPSRDEYRHRLFQLGIIPLGVRNDDHTLVPGKEWQAASEAWILRSYVMDTLDVDYDAEKGSGEAILKLIPETGDKHMAPAGSLTDADQQARFSGDTCLERMGLYKAGMTIL